MGTSIIHVNEPLDINKKIDELIWNDDNTSNFKMSGTLNIKKDEEVIFQITNGNGFSFIKQDGSNEVFIDIAISDTSYLSPGDYNWELNVYDNENVFIKKIFGNIIVLDNPIRFFDRQIKPWDSINDPMLKISKQKRDIRLEICKSCEKFKSNICIECGCAMTLKTMYADSSCPLHKWGIEEN